MPTIIFGIGGSGTRILRKIRQNWERDFGYLPDNVALAVIDAQITEPEGGPITDGIFSRNTLINFDREFDRYSELTESWWPPKATPSPFVDFSDGCGATRANGRFYVFRFYQQVRKTIDRAFKRVAAATPRAGTASGYEIYLVGSLGNGTGGGTFMDVATIVKHQLAHSGAVVQCMGVFITGSVTRTNNSGMIHDRVGANGYASLVEIQCEANRRDPEAKLRPPHGSYTFTPFLGPEHAQCAGNGQRNPDTVPPIDRAFLLEAQNSEGKIHSYPTLLNIAAESVYGLIAGADQSSRMLDAQVHAPPQCPFGSMSAVRLSVPAIRISEQVFARHSLSCLDLAESTDEENWADLLTEISPTGNSLLNSREATLDKSVSIFMEKILAIKEAGMDQLFNRFAQEDEQLMGGFSQLLHELGSTRKQSDQIIKADEICQFVEDNTVNLDQQRTESLAEGPDSLWLRQPDDPESPTDAGVRWLIDWRVRRFVQAGAFGLLGSWLQQFMNRLEENKRDVQENEHKRHIGDGSYKDIDLSTGMAELRKRSQSFIKIFGGSEIVEKLREVSQDAEKKFDFLLWSAKIQAVDQFYNNVYQHLDVLHKACARCVEVLSDPLVRASLEELDVSRAKSLDDNLAQKALRSGFSSEWFIGGDAKMRAEILAELEKGSDTSSREILHRLSDNNEQLFTLELGDDAREYRFATEKSDQVPDRTEQKEDLRRLVYRTVKKCCDRKLRRHCEIGDLLQSEAKRLAQSYYEAYHVDSDVLDEREKKRIKKEFLQHVPEEIFRTVSELPWATDLTGAMTTAIEAIVAGRLFVFINYCAPQWSAKSDGVHEYNRYRFVTYSDRATLIDQALVLIDDLNLFGDNNKMLAQKSSDVDARRVDIVVAEVGGVLSELNMTEDERLYKTVMEQKDFNPHLTRDYYEIGTHFLENTKLRHFPEGLLGFAEMYGYVKTVAGGSYKLAKKISQQADDGRVLWPAYAVGLQLERGMEKTIQLLAKKDTKSRQMRLAFKELIYEDIYRDAVETNLGWEGVERKIGEFCAGMQKQIATEQETSRAEAMQRMISEMSRTAAELASVKGKTPLFM